MFYDIPVNDILTGMLFKFSIFLFYMKTVSCSTLHSLFKVKEPPPLKGWSSLSSRKTHYANHKIHGMLSAVWLGANKKTNKLYGKVPWESAPIMLKLDFADIFKQWAKQISTISECTEQEWNEKHYKVLPAILDLSDRINIISANFDICSAWSFYSIFWQKSLHSHNLSRAF